MDWLKEILGDAFTDDVAGQIGAAIEKDYAPRGELEAAVAAKETAEGQLAEANTTIEGLKNLDGEAVQQVRTEWEEKYNQLKQEAAQREANLLFDGVLSEAVRQADGLSAVSIRAELGEERIAALKASKNQAEELQAAMAELKGERAFLFKTPEQAPPYAEGTGTAKMTEPLGDGTFKDAIAEALFPNS
ncbi:phage scaffolding protein [Ruminococcaceae bacterium OttesenSCG-928-A11]|nr:phage scaffolding protein [Ruminococcaceae bacterium OttesenSCG-928-A11]